MPWPTVAIGLRFVARVGVRAQPLHGSCMAFSRFSNVSIMCAAAAGFSVVAAASCAVVVVVGVLLDFLKGIGESGGGGGTGFKETSMKASPVRGGIVKPILTRVLLD